MNSWCDLWLSERHLSQGQTWVDLLALRSMNGAVDPVVRAE
jgi:hypothetical protein